MILSGQMQKYNLSASYLNTSEPISLSELRILTKGKFPNLPKLFNYAKAKGKKDSDLSDEEKKMFIE